MIQICKVVETNQFETGMVGKMAKSKQTKPRAKSTAQPAARARYPRHSVERALRIPKIIFEQNAGKPCTPEYAATLLGLTSARGPFGVEIASATKYGLLQRSGGKQRVRPLGLGLGDQEFQFAGLIAAKRKAGLVIAFHQQSGTAENYAETRQGFNWSWQVGKF